MHSSTSVILLNLRLYFTKKEKSSSIDEPYIMKKILLNFIVFIISPLLYIKLKL